MFTEKVTPRFGDADGLRHINNTALVEWFEVGRNPIFRMFTPDLDLSYEKWKLILVRTEFDYIGQMYYGIDVEITIGHEAWQNGELKAKGKAVLVHFDFLNQKSVPIPEPIKSQLHEHLILGDDIVDKNCK